jgi:hypothetical protein
MVRNRLTDGLPPLVFLGPIEVCLPICPGPFFGPLPLFSSHACCLFLDSNSVGPPHWSCLHTGHYRAISIEGRNRPATMLSGGNAGQGFCPTSR